MRWDDKIFLWQQDQCRKAEAFIRIVGTMSHNECGKNPSRFKDWNEVVWDKANALFRDYNSLVHEDRMSSEEQIPQFYIQKLSAFRVGLEFCIFLSDLDGIAMLKPVSLGAFRKSIRELELKLQESTVDK